MTPENQFVAALAWTESENNEDVRMGDGKRAVGRFQWHLDAYASWAPTVDEIKRFLGPNPTADACFTFAVQKFFLCAPAGKSLEDIAMAYHLHGQHVYGYGDDYAYRERFRAALVKVNAPS